jgi:hypothetical protein
MLASLKLKQTPVTTKSEEVDTELGPFLEYLNINFELLTDCLEESLAFEVIKAIWERLVAELDALLVPGLHLDSGSSDKAMLDESSVAIFQQAFTVCELLNYEI